MTVTVTVTVTAKDGSVFKVGPLSVPQVNTSGNGGWTTFVPTAPSGSGSSFAGAGTRMIYVSSSTGNDTTGNGTQATPYATINKGSSFLRTGHDDWLLLKCGDTFQNDNFGNFGGFSGSGMVVNPAWSVSGDHTLSGVILCTYYGTGARPLVQSNAAAMSGAGAMIIFEGSNVCSNLAFNGWEFYAYTRDPSNGSFSSSDAASGACDGIDMLVGGSNVLFEDCKFSFFCNAIVWSAGPYDTQYHGFTFRRCVVINDYNAGGGHGQGIFFGGTTNVIIDECVFDHNGWNSSVTGADQVTFNHNIYMSEPGGDGNTIIRGSIFGNDPGGIQLRLAGTIYNNLFALNASHLLGATNQSNITYNVIQNACDITGVNAQQQGFGIQMQGVLPNSILDHNIISNEISTAASFGINIQPVTQNTGTNITGNIGSGSNQITNVWNGGVAAGNGVGIEGWPIGTPITGAGIPANSVVTARTLFDDSGVQGTLTISNNATATTTGVALTVPTLTATVSNNIIFNHKGGLLDAGSGTILTNNCNDPNGTNSGQPGEPFPAPTRTLGGYNATLGGGATTTAFLLATHGQSKANYNLTLTANAACNYIRAGFNFPQL